MIGKDIHDFAKELWPINRSLTGRGNRETLDLIKARLPNLQVKEFKSGEKVFDWQIPQEWNCESAYIVTPSGERICDYSKNNLHLLGYSTPVKKKIELKELKNFLYSIPRMPNAIPYATSYYHERWGFCISEKEKSNLEDGVYEVNIDSSLTNGVLNYGELIIKGKSSKEVFLSTYICHPSMANNELSGIVVTTFLAEWISKLKNKYTYRIIFIPETIGSIAYISRNLKKMQESIIAGFNVSCVGDDRAYSYLPSRDGNTLSDKVAKHVLKHIDRNFKVYSWLDRGSDERQYCSPGVDLPIASIMRTKYAEYDEYHTSLDDLENVVTPYGLEGGFNALKNAIDLIENNDSYISLNLCEPNLGRRNLYPTLSIDQDWSKVKLLKNVLSYCDGNNDLLSISEILNESFSTVLDVIRILLENDLIKKI